MRQMVERGQRAGQMIDRAHARQPPNGLDVVVNRTELAMPPSRNAGAEQVHPPPLLPSVIQSVPRTAL
jgi:hypothetical protein